MNTKKIKIFARIFSIFMIFCFAFLCVGCMGKEPSDNDDDFGDLDGSGDDFFEELVDYTYFFYFRNKFGESRNLR